MGAMASQITSLTIVYSTSYSGANQRIHQSSASLAFVQGVHWWLVNSPHKWPVTRNMFPFDDIIMDCIEHYFLWQTPYGFHVCCNIINWKCKTQKCLNFVWKRNAPLKILTTNFQMIWFAFHRNHLCWEYCLVKVKDTHLMNNKHLLIKVKDTHLMNNNQLLMKVKDTHRMNNNQAGRTICVGSLTHWGRVTYICISKLTIIGSDNGLSPHQRQALIWANAWKLLIGSLGTKFSEILIEIHIVSFKKKCTWKCSLHNGVHFASASIC